MEDETPSSRQVVLTAVVVEGGLGLLALALSRGVGLPLMSRSDWSWAGVGWGVVAAVPLLAFLAIALRWPLKPFRELMQVMDETVIPMFRPCGWPELAVIAILAGLGEELLFRGIIQGSVGTWIGGPWGPGIGLLAASTLFGLLHPITRTYAVLAGLIGLYLGGVLLVGHNLLVPITAHAVYDFVALLYLVKWRDRPR